ncbi:MAG: hypothetical protein GY816_05645 [Cytophagales bacterium]|nr:hypothetical protein [Cytophagales bacterium]
MKTINQYRPVGRYFSLFLITFCTLFGVIAPLDGQSQTRTRLKVYYEKLPNSDKKISIILTEGKGKKTKGVGNALISISTVALDSTIELATITTDTIGEAFLFVEANYSFPKNEDGYSELNLNYSGNDSLKSAKKSIEFLDLNLDLFFDIVDSVKYLEVSAFEFDSTGAQMPIEEVGIKMGVKRLYSTLYLEEVDSDKDGVASMEFPNDIPGDSVGMITVIARVEDHDDYGTVTKTKTIDWGTAVDYSMESNGRSLFGDSAPLWMIISVAVILIGAWFHFLLAVYKVYKMSRLAKD